MKIYIILFIILCQSIALKARPTLSTGLKVGDTVPDINITGILNYKDQSATISSFKGKLLILDFWATWCSGCVLNLPKMESLQAQFGDKIQILAVTYEDRRKIENFFAAKRDADGRSYHFPSVTGDTVLRQFFPYRYIPHLVWINADGIVSAITDAEDVNEENITRLLSENKIDLVVKKDIDPRKPLFLSDNINPDSISYYSLLSKGSYPGLASGGQFRRKGTIVYGRAVTNANLIDIFEAAAYPLFEQIGDTYSRKRLVLKVLDSSEILMTRLSSGLYDTRALYNFDLIVPLYEADSLYNFMLADLNRSSKYAGKIVNRSVKCLALVRTNAKDKIKSKGGNPVNTLFGENPAFRNCPVSYFVNSLNGEDQIPYPVVDETYYTGNIDLNLSSGSNLQTLNKELSGYGLALVLTERHINLFEITEKSRMTLSASNN